MTYIITQKSSFMSDIFILDGTARNQLPEMHNKLKELAETPIGNTIKKLSGFKSLWRYRIADFRIIYAVRGNLVQLLAAGHRRDIYDRFEYDPNDPDELSALQTEAALFPNSEAANEHKNIQDWEQYSVEQMKREQERKAKAEAAKERLPVAITYERLIHWNIPEQFHETFIRCSTETELLDATAPEEIVSKVLNIVFPNDVELIAEEPLYVVPSGHALVDYVEGRISQFLLKLDEGQEALVEWALEGPTLVKGGPGSGKSTVAMYRVRAIIEKHISEGIPLPFILFTTYTNALCNVSQELLGQLLSEYGANFDVDRPDRIAVSLAKNSIGKLNIEGDDYWLLAVQSVRQEYKPNIGSALENSMFLRSIENLEDQYIADEIVLIIEGRGIPSIDDYLNSDRVGRKIGLNERQRQALWGLYQCAGDWVYEQNKITWSSVRRIALDALLDGDGPRYDYVIIDEAQDLTPVMLQLCVALVHDKRNIFMAADMSQSIYNHSFSYSKVHQDLDVSHRTRILKRNYRTTEEIVRGALEIMDGTGAGDEETLLQQCVKNGPKPIFYSSDDSDSQLDYVVHFIQENSRLLKLPTGAAAILCPTNYLAKRVAEACNKRGLPAIYMHSRDIQLEVPEVKVITMHASKGLEFPIVVIPFVNKDHIPGTIQFDTQEKQQEFENGQRRLLFVGATRAMRRLLITSNSDDTQSPFLQSFSSRGWNTIVDEYS